MYLLQWLASYCISLFIISDNFRFQDKEIASQIKAERLFIDDVTKCIIRTKMWEGMNRLSLAGDNYDPNINIK